MAGALMPVSDVRKELNSLLSRLDSPVFVTQRGRVRAVLVDVEQYQDLIDELEDLRDACDPELQRAFAEGAALAKDVDGAIARGDLVPFERAAQELGFDPHDLGEGESNGSDLHG